MHLPSKLLNSWFNSTKKTKPQSVELSIETLFWIPINRYLCSETVKCFCLEYCEYQLLRPQPMLHQSKQWSFNAWFVTSQTSTNFKVRYFLSTNQTLLLCKLLNISDAAFKTLNFLLWKLNTFGLIHLCLLTVERLIEVRTI